MECWRFHGITKHRFIDRCVWLILICFRVCIFLYVQYIYICIYIYTYIFIHIYIYLCVCVWADISRGMKFMWSWRGILGVVRCRPQWILEPGNFDSSRIYTAKVIKYACTSTHISVYNLIYIYLYAQNLHHRCSQM
jgi:hypothetical protein